jgi:hypothetical protein
MGVFGTGLYSGDLAMDLRSTVRAVLRLPFDADKLVDILSATEPTAANNPADDEHTTFWLVVADQFAKKGVASDRVREKALAIIDGGTDIAALDRLGMKEAALRKRQLVLDNLRARIVATAAPVKSRRVIRKPQPLLMVVGDVLVYPTCDGVNINPYFPSKEQNVHYSKKGRVAWQQNGWGAIVILDCGRAFEFLAWYRAAVLAETRSEKPTSASLRGGMLWVLRSPGTCSASHFKRMELEKIATFPIDRARAQAVFPGRFGSGVSAAVQDISIANALKSVPPGTAIPNPDGREKGRSPTLFDIEQVLRGTPFQA